MPVNLAAIGTQYVLEVPALGQLIAALARRGYQVVGPTLRGNAIVCDVLESAADLPAGWTADQEAAATRTERRGPVTGGLGGLGDTGALGTDKITFGPGGTKTPGN